MVSEKKKKKHHWTFPPLHVLVSKQKNNSHHVACYKLRTVYNQDWVQSLTRCFLEWLRAACYWHSRVHSAVFKIKSASFLWEAEKHRVHAVETPRTQELLLSLSEEEHANHLQKCELWLLSYLGNSTIREQRQPNFLPILQLVLDLPAAHKCSHEAHKPST